MDDSIVDAILNRKIGNYYKNYDNVIGFASLLHIHFDLELERTCSCAFNKIENKMSPV